MGDFFLPPMCIIVLIVIKSHSLAAKNLKELLNLILMPISQNLIWRNTVPYCTCNTVIAINVLLVHVHVCIRICFFILFLISVFYQRHHMFFVQLTVPT